MSHNGRVPNSIGRANRAGVPWVGLIVTDVFARIIFLGQSSSASRVYSVFSFDDVVWRYVDTRYNQLGVEVLKPGT